MAARQVSLVDALINGRYRVDAVVRRSEEAVIYDATHRNGVRAWIKVPSAPAFAAGITLEGSIANAVGSAMRVRDDGETDGMPYLVLDPVEGGTTIAQRLERAGGRLPVDEVVSIGRSLAEIVGAMHELGYASAPHHVGLLKGNGGLEFDSVMVLPSFEIALLALDHAAPATDPVAKAADLQRIGAMLYRMVVGEDRTPMSVPLEMLRLVPGEIAAAIDDAFAMSIGGAKELAAVLAGRETRKRKARAPVLVMPAKIETPATPMALEVPSFSENSVIAYLKTGDDAEAARTQAKPAGGPREVASPLTREFELPRLVQATVTVQDTRRRNPTKTSRPLVPILAIGLPVLAGVAALALLLSRPDPAPAPPANGVLARSEALTTAAGASGPKLTAELAPRPFAEPVATATPASADDLELDDVVPAAAPAGGGGGTSPTGSMGALRTIQAPDGRRVFIDGKVVGQTPLQTSVPCGPRMVQIGTHGAPVRVEVPCGGVRTLRFDGSGKFVVD